jgi:hypothetical protein
MSFQMSGNKKEDERKIAGTIPFIAPELFQMVPNHLLKVTFTAFQCI